MPFIQVGQENSAPIELYYEDVGQGAPVVLIHGWPLNGRSWEKQTQVLVEAGYRVISYDRRGFGLSSKPSTGYDYDTFTSDLDKLMTELDLRNATLVGFSMGSSEVTHYLATYGSMRVSKAVMIGVVPPFLLKTEDNPTGVEESVFDGIKQAMRHDRLAFFTEFFKNFYNLDKLLGNRISEEAVRWSWNAASMSSPIGSLECVSTWTTDFREGLEKIDVPCLIMHGDEDRVLPIAATAELLHQEIRGSRLVVLQGGPHGVLWTHAEEVNEELLTFLQEGVEKRIRPHLSRETSPRMQ